MNEISSIRRFSIVTGIAIALLVAGCHSDKPADHLARGKEAAAKKNHATAIIEFKNVLQSNPDSSEARFLLGRELLAQNDPKNAEIELQKAFDLAYDPDQVVPLLVRSQVMQGQTDKVTRQIGKESLKTPAANAALQTLLGSSLFSQGKLDEAMSAYAAALKFVPDYPDAVLGAARIKAVRGDVATADTDVAAVLAKDPKELEALLLKGDLARTKGSNPAAIAAYEAAVKESPRNFTARLGLTGAYIANRQFDLAQQQVDELKKQQPKQPGVNYMDALIAFNKKDLTRANDAISLSLAAAPNSGLAQLLAGTISTALNQPEQAEAHLREAIRLNPGSIYARRLLTSLYLRQRQAQKAEEVLGPALAAQPNDAKLIGLAGEVALAKGDFTSASQYFDQAGKINPADSNLRTQGAAVDFARGDEASGFAELEAASKASVNNPNPDIALVLARVQRKQFDQALTAWKTLEKRQPDNPVTYNLRAAIYMGKGDPVGARKALEHALEIQPNYFPAAANLAVLDERNNDLDGARKRYRALLAKEPGNLAASIALAQFESKHGGGPDVVLPLLTDARRVNPNSEQPVIALAAYYISRNDPKQALATAQDGLAQSPNSPGLLGLVGQILLRTGSTDQAIADFRKRASLNPDSVGYQMDLGKALVTANQNDQASQVFQGVLKKRPDTFEAQSAAVGTLLRTNKLDQAAALVAQLRQQSPKSPVLPELDGDVKLASKQYGDAAGIYRQLLAKSPGSNLVIKTYTAILLGGHGPEADTFLADWIKNHPKDIPVRLFDADLALRAKNYSHAAQSYRAALEIRPNDPALLNNLAWTLWQQKDPQALAYAQKANAAAPNSPAIGDTLGWMLVEQGQTKSGLALLQKANAAAPAQRDIALHLAKAQIKAGDKDAARSTLQALVKAAPESAEGKESKDLMATL